jgi:tetratricopeptide (TPR) repeat protein
MVWLDTLQAFVEADLGQDEAAVASAESALARANGLGQVALQCRSLYARAYLHIRSQEWEEALILCDRGTALYIPTDNCISPLFLGLAHVKALWGAGRLAEAADRVTEYLALARATGSLHYEGMALGFQGGIAAAQGADEEALRAFEAAIARLEELGSRLELGRALAQRALWWQAQGQTERAQADAARAQAIFEACGARRDLEQMLTMRASSA